MKTGWPHTVSCSVRVSESFSNTGRRACSMIWSFVNSLHRGLLQMNDLELSQERAKYKERRAFHRDISLYSSLDPL